LSAAAGRIDGMDETAERILSGLDPEQAHAVRATRGPVCILAGAGTGKTRAITHRIAYMVATGAAPAGQILAVTFTNRAAGEMRSRLRALGAEGVQARTFHSAALRQLQYFAPRVLGGPMPRLMENKLRLVATAATRCRLRADRALLRDLASEIEWAKSSVITPQDYVQRSADVRQPPVEASTAAQVYAAYEEVKSRAEVLDFEDLLLITAAAIEEHRDVAEEVRARYRHFVVDEYQDVSPLQERLLQAWLGGRDDLCVVGDAAQTIYTFAGANASYLLEFPRRYPRTTVVRLERDYRSTPQVVGLANRLMAASGSAARLTLVGQRAAGPEPTFAEHDDEPAEAAAVARAAKQLIERGVPAAEIAVLYRINAQSESYESALSAESVPYVLRGGERFFERPEIREAMVLLRGGSRSVEEGQPLEPAVRDILSASGWSPEAPPGGGAARERWESLAALVNLAADQARDRPDAGLSDFVAELARRAESQHAPTVQGVTLASLHAAKGLEWDAVFLVGLTEGVLPIQYAATDEAVEEERRLLYVGITRAREHLSLSWALARNEGGRRSRKRSRFLDALAPAAVHARPARRQKIALDGADAELFEALRAWRKARAADDAVAPYLVFSDATLGAIVRSRPTSTLALAKVSGVGPYKLDRYGEDVVAIIAEAG
jgi:DNA helicase-2/ATP-dependent DNA helicase PcrA